MANFLTRTLLTRSFLTSSLLAVGAFTITACVAPASTEAVSEQPTPASSVEASDAVTDPETAAEVVPSATEAPAAEGSILATGQFTGVRGHVVTGGVEVVEVDGEYFIHLGDDFSLDDAPDPKVGLGQDGYDPATKAGELIAFTGASTYQVPEGVNPEDYNEVHIWCERFNVPLGVASLVVAE